MTSEFSPVLFYTALAAIPVLLGWIVVRGTQSLRKPATAKAETAPKECRFECPHCDQHIFAGPEFLGTKVTCPNCAGEFSLPKPKGWPAGVNGLRTVAVGAWVEMFLRVYPNLSKALGFSTAGKEPSLLAQMVWPEVCMILGTVVCMAGLAACLRTPRPPKALSLLLSCLLLECGAVVAEVFLLMNLREGVLTNGSTEVAVYGSLARLASYSAGIILLKFLRHESADWDTPSKRGSKGLRLAMVLIGAVLLQLLVVCTPLLDLSGLNANSGSGWKVTAIGLVMGLAVLQSWGRLLWLFSFGRSLHGYAQAASRQAAHGRTP